MPDDSSAISPDASPEVAITQLLDLEGGRLYSLGLRLCGGPEAAEDLVQEIFLNALTGWKSFAGRSSPRTWLYTIAAHACQRMKRKRAGEPAQIRSLEDLLPMEAETMVDLDQLEREGPQPEQLAAVEAVIAELEDDFRLPLVLKDVVGLPMATVAAVLDLNENTAKTRIHRARLKIRKALAEVLPSKRSVPLAYSQQVCLDLLAAKQSALDRQVPFPLDDIICERCQVLFKTIDFAGDLCRQLSQGQMPGVLRERLLREISKK